MLFDKDRRETVLRMGDYRFTCRHDHTLGWLPGADDPEWPATGAIIVQTGGDEFYVAGTGVVVTFESAEGAAGKPGILRADEGRFIDGAWRSGRRLNGDQTHQGRHLRIPLGEYDIQRVTLYRY
jgi:hypothetical protein